MSYEVFVKVFLPMVFGTAVGICIALVVLIRRKPKP